MAAVCLLLGTTAAAQEAQMTSKIESKVQIPNVYFELDNGLSIFLLQDNSLPIITANLWFNVGSKDERPGRTFRFHGGRRQF
jgi:zinc protease